MRQIQLQKPGIENLVLAEVEQPEPGPGEVLVKVHAASINYRDFLIAMGFYGGPGLTLPLVPLSDGAGEVIETGSGVTQVQAGDRVTSLFWQDWQDGVATPTNRSISTGCEAPGMLTEYTVMPESAVARVPDSLTYDEAATLPCAGLTAWSSLTTHARVKAGETVLLMGTGGVSLFGLQFAKALGATTIITSSSDEKLERARELGADHVINYKETPEWGAKAFELASGGVDVVIEIGGAGTLQQSLAAVGLSGRIAYVGTLTGMNTDLNLLELLGKNLQIHGLTVGNHADHEKMVGFIDEHGLSPVIDARSELEQGAETIANIAAGQHFGKLVVTLAE